MKRKSELRLASLVPVRSQSGSRLHLSGILVDDGPEPRCKMGTMLLTSPVISFDGAVTFETKNTVYEVVF